MNFKEVCGEPSVLLLLWEPNACYCRRCGSRPELRELACMDYIVTNNKEDCMFFKCHCRTGKQAVGIVKAALLIYNPERGT